MMNVLSKLNITPPLTTKFLMLHLMFIALILLIHSLSTHILIFPSPTLTPTFHYPPLLHSLHTKLPRLLWNVSNGEDEEGSAIEASSTALSSHDL